MFLRLPAQMNLLAMRRVVMLDNKIEIGRTARRITVQELDDCCPEKIEMIEGQLFWSEEDRLRMLALLLANVGIDRAVRLGRREDWRAALKDFAE